jgi:hypothetical protein
MPSGGWEGFFDDSTLRLPVHMQRIVQANIQQTSALSTLTSIAIAACPALPAHATIVAVEGLFRAVDVELKEAGKRMMSEAPLALAMLDAGKTLRETVAMPTATDFTGSLSVVLSDLKKVMLANARDLLGRCQEPKCTKMAVTSGGTGKCSAHGGGTRCATSGCNARSQTGGVCNKKACKINMAKKSTAGSKKGTK